MKLRQLSNETYSVLEYMKSVEVNYKGEFIVIESQQDMAEILHIGKVKINKIIKQLVEIELIVKYTGNGKYKITDLGNRVIKKMSSNI